MGSEPPTNSERVRKNEETFASANEEIRLSAEKYDFEEAVPFLCECSKLECMETIRLPLTSYRETRAQGDVFIVREGHNDPNVERIVGSVADYVLVEKFA